MSIEETKLDLYWKMYNEHATQARQHETLRGVVSGILVTLSTGLTSLYVFAHDKFPANHEWIFGVLFIVIGVLGGLISYKHYERNRFHVDIMLHFGGEIEKVLETIGASVNQPSKNGADHHDERYWFWSKLLKLHHLWTALFAVIVMEGIDHSDEMMRDLVTSGP